MLFKKPDEKAPDNPCDNYMYPYQVIFLLFIILIIPR